MKCKCRGKLVYYPLWSKQPKKNIISKCLSCGRGKVTKYPLWAEEPGRSRFIWQNLFKMELTTLFIIIGVILIVLGTYVMLNETKEIQKHPCKWCEENGCCSQPSYCYPDYKPAPIQSIGEAVDTT